MAALQNPLASLMFDDILIGQSRVLLAVSGGGDSVAMLDLYRLARLKNLKLPCPYIVTVDHGLRSGFAREAALVEAYCARHNLPWQLLHWAGEKPKTGIMAAARQARYRLLAEAALSVGSRIILTGHTLDDQIETALMRASRGPVSSMESEVIFQRQTLILRPMLTISRAVLRAHLAGNAVDFADDPTNSDIRFERTRVRGQIKQAPIDTKSIERRHHLISRAAEFISQYVQRRDDELLISRPVSRDLDCEVYAMRYLAATLGGFEYPAAASVGLRLAALLNRGPNGTAYTAQRSCFVRVSSGISVGRDLRHKDQPWLDSKISPFECFCAKSMMPLANALAKNLGAPQFILPNEAAI